MSPLSSTLSILPEVTVNPKTDMPHAMQTGRSKDHDEINEPRNSFHRPGHAVVYEVKWTFARGEAIQRQIDFYVRTTTIPGESTSIDHVASYHASQLALL